MKFALQASHFQILVGEQGKWEAFNVQTWGSVQPGLGVIVQII